MNGEWVNRYSNKKEQLNGWRSWLFLLIAFYCLYLNTDGWLIDLLNKSLLIWVTWLKNCPHWMWSVWPLQFFEVGGRAGSGKTGRLISIHHPYLPILHLSVSGLKTPSPISIYTHLTKAHRPSTQQPKSRPQSNSTHFHTFSLFHTVCQSLINDL